MNSEQQYQEAKKRVRKKKGFYSHLASYVIINAVMFTVTFTDSGSLDWLYPMLFWGIGIGFHYFGVFGFPGTGAGGADWEAKEIEKEMDKLANGSVELPPDKMELKEIQKREEDWDDKDFV